VRPSTVGNSPILGLRLVLLTFLFSVAAAYESVRLTALSSCDVWWHLRTGLWILQNHAIPRTGLFSQYPGLPWNASSWGFDLLLAAAYGIFGLRAIPILLMVFKVALAAVTFFLARVGRADVWTAVFLSAIAQYVIPNLQPLPSVLSILFFGVELMLLVQSRRTGTLRGLFWLPPLFVLWANLHLQFVIGLLLLGLFLLALVLEQGLRSMGVTWLSARILPLPLGKVGGLVGLSVLCTFANPYSFRLFPAFTKALYSPVSFQYFAEMRAMSFRQPRDYALMLLVMAAFFALGRRRSLEVFEVAALVAGTVLAFRIQRDVWLAVLPAVAVLSDGFQFGQRDSDSHRVGPRWEKPLIAGLVMATFVAAALRLPERNILMSKISQNFPVKACDFIVQNHLPQPLFNSYVWGGFLTWYMPEYPVAVDGRVDLYGDEILARYFQVIGGNERLDADPSRASPQTLLLERQSGMADALLKLPALRSQYRMLYSDDLAAVFVRQ
jgi:hypothetical protein